MNSDRPSINRNIAFIGCGVMAEAMVAGLLKQSIFLPEQITSSHPREERRNELSELYGIETKASNREIAGDLPNGGILVLAVKPQRLAPVLSEIGDVIAGERLVISIVAGARIDTIAGALGTNRVIRAMPNTPARIAAGMTAWTCAESVGDGDRQDVETILGALGAVLYVETENMIDMATSLSATGPTYIFMVMEALTDAGVHLGFSREVAKELVQQTMLGSVRFAMESHKHPAELRNMVTSPGGTSAEAVYQMEKGGLRTVLSKAVHAAYQRAVELGKRS